LASDPTSLLCDVVGQLLATKAAMTATLAGGHDA
jgi:hypothetical protein